MRTLVVVDGANVVGSVPDGGWPDRTNEHVQFRRRLGNE
jgi:hypothetical protein